ncbi:MAG: hypothetical protein LUD76_02810 [Alistipes sp.]|nr:hypothetical protein [Alistipes sp.]
MRYPILKYIFLSFAVFTPLSAQEVIPYPPTHYKETPFGIEWIEELPRDTVVLRDTVYVSDLDGFLSRFVGREVDLNRLVRDVAGIEALVDSLEGVSQQALFITISSEMTPAGTCRGVLSSGSSALTATCARHWWKPIPPAMWHIRRRAAR